MRFCNSVISSFLNTVFSIIRSYLTWGYRLSFYSQRRTAQTAFMQMFTTAVNLFTQRWFNERTIPNVLVLLWLDQKPTQSHSPLFTQQVDQTKALKTPEEVSDPLYSSHPTWQDSASHKHRLGIHSSYFPLKHRLLISDCTRFIYINLSLERPKQDRPPLSFQGL